jgi:hypothetical protein
MILEKSPDVKALSKGLLTVQLAALESVEGYTNEDAYAILDAVGEMVDLAANYNDLVVYVISKLTLANNLAGAAIFIIGDDIELMKSDAPISSCDAALVKKHLAKQRLLIAIYSGSN